MGMHMIFHSWLPDNRILYDWKEYIKDGDSWEMIESVWTVKLYENETPQPASDYPVIYNKRAVRDRLPEGLGSWQYTISPDGDWIVYSSQDQIYAFSWETGEVIGPLAHGTHPIWMTAPVP